MVVRREWWGASGGALVVRREWWGASSEALVREW